ncbi:MAG TPA: S8 family serine peptidase [Sphingomonas sp.]|nr:S8 family serine peptidase [Sphingomonas sp.]
MKITCLTVLIGLATPGTAQLLGGVAGGVTAPIGSLTSGSLPSGILGNPGQGSVVAGLQGPLAGVGDSLRSIGPRDLVSLRHERLRALMRDNRRELDTDDAGNPIRRDEIVGLDMAPDTVARVEAAGFKRLRSEAIAGLNLVTTIFTPPKGKPARKAIAILRGLDPAGNYSLNAVYEPARASLAPAGGPLAGAGAPDRRVRIGLIDGGVGRHPALAGAHIDQRGFAGDPRPSGHGTAVASLMVGESGAFHGVAPGADLMVADVYGGSPANGSATAIVRAMGWLAEGGVRVINISLVGPPNALLAAGINRLLARGVIVVAAVGNDGPAAPPQYPASYAGVIAVTGVDSKGKALIEAGRALHLDFAAPAADIVGAVPGGGWEKLRGTSFAAPFVTASIARLGPGHAAAVATALVAQARPGRGAVGRGIVCGACGTPPKLVGIN